MPIKTSGIRYRVYRSQIFICLTKMTIKRRTSVSIKYCRAIRKMLRAEL